MSPNYEQPTVSLSSFRALPSEGMTPAFEIGQGDITLTASANLLTGIRFLGDLMHATEESLDYDFKARLDLQGLYPSISVTERGAFDVRPSPHQELVQPGNASVPATCRNRAFR
jgi:hypothetical protein